MAILSDGTRLTDLIDADRRAISARVLSDPEIFQLELDRIWARSWIFVAHASELPRPGDYVLRRMGSDHVIVCRDSAGEINVLLNVCAHRAAQVCHADQGSAQRFECPYHGWIYDLGGALIGVPAEKQMYRDGLDRSSFRLRRAEVGVRHGLVFARWPQDGPGLADSLGSFSFYLDMYLGSTDGGWQVAGPPQRWRIPANWKIPAENFAGDAYHSLSTHRSEESAGRAARGTMMKSQYGVAISDAEHGHGGRATPMRGSVPVTAADLARLFGSRFPAVPASAYPEIERNLTDDQYQLVLLGAAPFVGSVFPNLGFLSASFPRQRGGPLEPGVSIRTWVPLDSNTIEFISWALVHAQADEPTRQRGRRQIAYTFGSAGTLEQDDTEAWAQIQLSAASTTGRQQWMHYGSTAGPSQIDEDTGRKWPGPGEVRMGFGTDDNQWNWWQRWLRELTGETG